MAGVSACHLGEWLATGYRLEDGRIAASDGVEWEWWNWVFVQWLIEEW